MNAPPTIADLSRAANAMHDLLMAWLASNDESSHGFAAVGIACTAANDIAASLSELAEQD